jgi:hypothetical protein
MKTNLIARCVASSVVLLGSSLVGTAQQGLALPMVSHAEVPLYPPLARVSNVSGVVHVIVTTDGHVVVTAHAKEGPKLLRDAAEKNAMSWQFTTHEPTTFTVTYVYKLVDDLNPQLNNPRVILQLPTEVEVDAQRWPASHDMPADQPSGAALNHEAGHTDPPIRRAADR